MQELLIDSWSVDVHVGPGRTLDDLRHHMRPTVLVVQLIVQGMNVRDGGDQRLRGRLLVGGPLDLQDEPSRVVQDPGSSVGAIVMVGSVLGQMRREPAISGSLALPVRE